MVISGGNGQGSGSVNYYLFTLRSRPLVSVCGMDKAASVVWQHRERDIRWLLRENGKQRYVKSISIHLVPAERQHK